MEQSANNNGKMTPERADAIKAFVREFGTDVDNQTIKSAIELRRPPIVSKEQSAQLGMQLVTESDKMSANSNKIRELISKGADVDFAFCGATALMCASLKGHYKIVEALLNAGADPNMKNHGGITALMYASIHGNMKITKILLDFGADASLKDKDDNTLLIHAAQGGNNEIVKMMLNMNVDAGAENCFGYTALTYVKNEEVKELIEEKMRSK